MNTSCHLYRNIHLLYRCVSRWFLALHEFVYLEFAYIIWMILTKLFQTVSSLLSSFMTICGNLFTIERVHTAHIFFVQCSSIVATKLFKLIRHAIIDTAVVNIVRQNGASNTIGIEPMVFAYAVRCTIIVCAFSCCYKKCFGKIELNSFVSAGMI